MGYMDDSYYHSKSYLIQRNAQSTSLPYLDKVAHFSFYFGYTVLFILAFRSKLWAVITALFLGATMEILQGLLTTTRSADYIDMLFNTFGTVVALLFMRKYEKLFR